MTSYQQVICSMEVRDIEQLGQMFDNTEAHTVKIRRKPSTSLSRSAVSLDVSKGHSKTSPTGRRRLVASDFGSSVDVEDFKAQLRTFANKAGTDSITLCTCQQSRNFPYCDSTHVVFNKETNSNLSPIIIKLIDQPTSPNTQHSTCTQQCHSTPDTTQHGPQHLEDDKPEDKYEEPTPITKTYTPSNINDPVNKHNVFTKEEVAKHRTKDSLWMIINNNVYDITEYIPHHPGGERALIKFGGIDGSENVEFHSKSMLQLLNKFYFIGKLETQQNSFCIIS